MAIDLTSKPLSSTYDQLLHVDDGPIAEEKTVYSGTGVPTALKLGTGSASVDNVRIDGSTISTVTPGSDLVLAPNGSGKVKITKAEITDQLTNVTIAGGQISNANIAGGQISNANIAGGQISNVNIAGGQISNANIIGGTFHGVTPTPAGVALLDDADAAAQRATLGLGTAATKNVGTSGDAVPLLNGNNTFSGSNTFPSPTTAGNPLIRGNSVSLPNGVDLNTVVDTGFYRLNNSVVNGPAGTSVNYGQLIVSKGLNTITQIVASYVSGEMWTRSGSPPEVGGGGAWSPWQKMTLSNNDGVAPHYACRAWVCFNGAGIVSILASGGVYAITDNGIGDYTLHFSYSMPDTNYSIACGIGWSSYVNNGGVWVVKTEPSYMTTTSVRIRTVQLTTQVLDSIDPDRVFIQIIR